MILPVITIIWVSIFTSLAVFQIYRPAGKRKEPKWLRALEVPAEALSGSRWELLAISAAGLFLELMMIRWISAEITIFAYFKNFVLIACFLGFGLGAHLCRRPINLLSTIGPMIYFALLIKLPWPALRGILPKLTSLLGSTTEVDVWGVPLLPWNSETFSGLAVMLAVVIPLFLLLSLTFIPIGQMTAKLMDGSQDGITRYSINIVGSFLGIVLYTGLCLYYQPPTIWFLIAGVLLVLSFRQTKIRVAVMAAAVFCAIFAGLPESNESVQQVLSPGVTTKGGKVEWSPYQKLHWAETVDHGETVAYQLLTNDNWYQQVVDLSDPFILSHPDMFGTTAPKWNAYNMPYQFYPKPPSVLVLGAGMGNDVAAALRNGADHVTAVEIDPMIIALGRRLHPEHPYSNPKVTIINDDARSYMENSKGRFDLISLCLLDSHTTSSHYSNIRIDNYVYTREAVTAAKNLLTPGGILITKFQVAKPFIAGRLKATLKEVFNADPVQFNETAFQSGESTAFVSGNSDRLAKAVQEPELKHYLETHGKVETATASITTDDWPFFYQHEPGLPSSVILISLVLIIVCWQLMKRTAVPVSKIAGSFFFLGAGFMLMESQIVSRMALLFGTTWLVNSITVAGILLLIVVANLLENAGVRIPTTVAYGALFAAALVAYFVPVSSLLSESRELRVIAAIVVLCGPVFFASVIFIRTFAAARFSGSALGSNLVGALVGGMLESLSMWIGLKSLLFLTILLYGLAYYFSLRKQPAEVTDAIPVVA